MGQIRKPGNPQAYLFLIASTIRNGALAMWDTVTGAVQEMTAAADFAAFIGVTEFQNPQSSPLDTSQTVLGNTPHMGLVRRTGVFTFNTTPAESYVHGNAVKMGADALTIALDAGAGQIIGYVNLPDGSTVTGAAGVTVEIEIKPNFGSPSILNA